MEHSTRLKGYLPAPAKIISFARKFTRPGIRRDGQDDFIPSDGSKRVKHLTQAHIDRLVRELAPKVQANTGYKLDPSKMTAHLVSRREAAGYGHDAQLFHWTWAFSKSKMQNGLAFHRQRLSILGTYSSLESKLRVARKAAKENSWNQLRGTIYHELIHAAQHQAYPHHDDDLGNLIDKALTGESAARFDLPHGITQRVSYADRVLGRQALKEGEAFYQELLFTSSLKPTTQNHTRFQTRWARSFLNKYGLGHSKVMSPSNTKYQLGLNYFSAVARKRIDERTVHYLYTKPKAAEYYLSSEARIKELSRRFPGAHGALTDED